MKECTGEEQTELPQSSSPGCFASNSARAPWKKIRAVGFALKNDVREYQTVAWLADKPDETKRNLLTKLIRQELDFVKAEEEENNYLLPKDDVICGILERMDDEAFDVSELSQNHYEAMAYHFNCDAEEVKRDFVRLQRTPRAENIFEFEDHTSEHTTSILKTPFSAEKQFAQRKIPRNRILDDVVYDEVTGAKNRFETKDPPIDTPIETMIRSILRNLQSEGFAILDLKPYHYRKVANFYGKDCGMIEKYFWEHAVRVEDEQRDHDEAGINLDQLISIQTQMDPKRKSTNEKLLRIIALNLDFFGFQTSDLTLRHFHNLVAFFRCEQLNSKLKIKEILKQMKFELDEKRKEFEDRVQNASCSTRPSTSRLSALDFFQNHETANLEREIKNEPVDDQVDYQEDQVPKNEESEAESELNFGSEHSTPDYKEDPGEGIEQNPSSSIPIRPSGLSALGFSLNQENNDGEPMAKRARYVPEPADYQLDPQDQMRFENDIDGEEEPEDPEQRERPGEPNEPENREPENQNPLHEYYSDDGEDPEQLEDLEDQVMEEEVEQVEVDPAQQLIDDACRKSRTLLTLQVSEGFVFQVVLQNLVNSMLENSLPLDMNDRQLDQLTEAYQCTPDSIKLVLDYFKMIGDKLVKDDKGKPENGEISKIIDEILKNQPISLGELGEEAFKIHREKILKEVYSEIIKNNFKPILHSRQKRQLASQLGYQVSEILELFHKWELKVLPERADARVFEQNMRAAWEESLLFAPQKLAFIPENEFLQDLLELNPGFTETEIQNSFRKFNTEARDQFKENKKFMGGGEKAVKLAKAQSTGTVAEKPLGRALNAIIVEEMGGVDNLGEAFGRKYRQYNKKMPGKSYPFERIMFMFRKANGKISYHKTLEYRRHFRITLLKVLFEDLKRKLSDEEVRKVAKYLRIKKNGIEFVKSKEQQFFETGKIEIEIMM